MIDVIEETDPALEFPLKYPMGWEVVERPLEERPADGREQGPGECPADQRSS